MTTTITKRFTFDAAHQLPNHDGKCRQPHGHTYTVELTIEGVVRSGTSAPDDGMVMDFAYVKDVWRELCEPWLDHRDLNESIGAPEEPNRCWPTTAENIAAWIYRQAVAALAHRGGTLVQVQVGETPTSWATVTP